MGSFQVHQYLYDPAQESYGISESIGCSIRGLYFEIFFFLQNFNDCINILQGFSENSTRTVKRKILFYKTVYNYL
uniref:Uncharacterized protein n=1 Tax=Octopus bimaculoides TaxID=37653 RepID=A0A0L8FPW8_OCTBM